MKTNILKSVIVLVITAGALSSCVKDNDFAVPALQCTQPNLTANRTVKQVIDVTTDKVTQYAQEDIIEAYVVSSDEGGNFYKSISLQTLPTSTTPAIGFSVPVDASNTYIDYRPGVKVYIKMKDLYTDIKDGSMRVGAIYVDPTKGTASVGRMTVNTYKQKLIASCTNASEETLVKKTTLANLITEGDANLNTLVEISNVQLENAALGRNYYDATNDVGGATNWNLTDADGNMLILRTSSYANYASKEVPSGNGKVRGVLTKYGTDYQFMARTEKDIVLTNTRFAPLFEEDFSTNFPAWQKISIVGSQVWTLDPTYGHPGSCAKMSGYAGGNNANEDWLISPSIDLTAVSTASLTFDSAAKFSGDDIQIYISSDYVGTGAPTTATWTQLTATLSPNTGSYVWTNSGSIDISAFKGKKVYVAFKYISTATSGTTWEIDNVKVKGN